jgi:hypothetical protein
MVIARHPLLEWESRLNTLPTPEVGADAILWLFGPAEGARVLCELADEEQLQRLFHHVAGPHGFQLPGLRGWPPGYGPLPGVDYGTPALQLPAPIDPSTERKHQP